MSPLVFSPSAASSSATVSSPTLPAWLDATRPDDRLAASAYENTPAPLRALLKSAIALYFQLWGEMPAEKTHRVRNPAAGFAWQRAERPVPWTLAVMDPAYASPARLLAALLPAVLAGVDMILVVCPDQPPAPVQNVALDLAGLENLYVVPSAGASAPTVRDLVHELAAQGEGRLLLFPTEQSRFSSLFQTLRETARSLPLRLWEDRPAPRIALIADDADGEDKADEAILRNNLQWAHGDAVVRRVSPGVRPEWNNFAAWCAARPDIFEELAAGHAPLLLGPGMEACWLHDGVIPAFFRTVRHAIRLYP